MVDKAQDQLADKLGKSPLPIEFNRKKQLLKFLVEKKQEETEKCLKLMKEIIEKKNRGESIEELYA